MGFALRKRAEEWARRLDLQGFQAIGRLWHRVGHLPVRTVGAGQLRQLNAPQPIRDIAPSVPTGVLDRVLEQQRRCWSLRLLLGGLRQLAGLGQVFLQSGLAAQ